MRVLLVEPDYLYHRRSINKFEKMAESEPSKRPNDDILWYPPLGLMKISAFHKMRGDEVFFTRGLDKEAIRDPDLFNPFWWDRVYITTLFTYEWKETIKTIQFYKKAVGNSYHKIYVGGIMASLMEDDIFKDTSIYPISGVLVSPSQIDLEGDEVIDLLTPDYGILDNRLYAINDTYYGYTSRGCVNHCSFCGVPVIEPEFTPYIDIKSMIEELRSLPGDKYGDKPKLKLMDNNILASPRLEQIVDDLLELGYGKDDYTCTNPKRKRVVDFNQGLDAKYFTEDRVKMISKLNIEPVRIAFDRVEDRKVYIKAIQLAREYGFTRFSNYMLFNWKDNPKDLYERLIINTNLNREWKDSSTNGSTASIYSYPMRHAPIRSKGPEKVNRNRDFIPSEIGDGHNLLDDAIWNRRFIRNIEVMKSAANGAISPTPGLAFRTLGESYEEFLTNLYMPEQLLRNRNKYEKRVYVDEPSREPGTGDVEDFRNFIINLLNSEGKEKYEFYSAVSQNSLSAIQEYYDNCENKEIRKWLTFYMMK